MEKHWRLKMKLAPKDWTTFQHYKDRSPPWIKLHKYLLDDSRFQRLPVASRALAPMLWLLASEQKDGVFNGSVSELAFRLRQTDKEIDAALKPLISNGFFEVVQDASDVLAECKPDAIPETEERQRESKRQRTEVEPPDGVLSQTWADFLILRKAKKSPMTATALSQLERESRKASMSLQSVLETCCQRGWTGFKADWLQTGETAYQKSMREKVELVAPSISTRKDPNDWIYGETHELARIG